MAKTEEASGRRWVRRWPVGVIAGLAIVMSACVRDAPLEPGGAARAPDHPSALLNPLCNTAGGQTHAGQTITTAVTWAASGSPHKVMGTVTLGTGGQLTIDPGVVVCFEPQTGLQSYGGRLVAQGLAASRVILTARDPALGWNGISLNQEPSSPSVVKNATIEFVARTGTGVWSYLHPVAIDSTIIRQSGRGVTLWGRQSSLSRSRVDTTTNRYSPAVTLNDSTRFEQSIIRRAAGIGLLVEGVGIVIAGGRIENSGGIGISANQFAGIPWATAPIRVVGGSSYPLETSARMMRGLYPTSTWQDSLKGNARDTVLMRGGNLGQTLLVRPGVPWHVTGSIEVSGSGALRGEPGSRLVLDPDVGITAHSGGRVNLRGSAANPVVLTADDPSLGWEGITLSGGVSISAGPSYVTNTRLEHVAYDRIALVAQLGHSVTVDSAVFRQNGRAVSLLSFDTRISRSRVDTTLSSSGPAVELGGGAVLESTLIRASSGDGLALRNDTVYVASCEVRESVGDGIVLDVANGVHNCNLVDNLGVGIRNLDPSWSADATGNWWGDSGGPTGPAGDGVAGAVTYTPWLTSRFVLPYVP